MAIRMTSDPLVGDRLPTFTQAEIQRLSRPDRQREIGGGRPAELDERDQMRLTGVWLRWYPTHEVLGDRFGVSASTVSRIIQRVWPLLEPAGRETLRQPDPGRQRRRNWDDWFSDPPELAGIIDRFEQQVQRPQDPNERDRFSSGKKQTPTLKRQVAVNEDSGAMIDGSNRVPGPTADIQRLEPSKLMQPLPEGVGGIGDLADVGIDRLPPPGLGAGPGRKPRGKPRPPAEVADNTAFSRRRIMVENTIGRLRRYQSLTQTDRQHRHHHTARVCAVAGLVNRQLAHRIPA
jgi:hypothetical protein